MEEIELRMVHRGARIWATVEYEFDDHGNDILIASVKCEGRDILKELPEREIEQLQEHIHSLLRQDALDRAEAAWVSNREGA